MSCPFLKEVVMLYCDACPFRKMLPLDRLVSASPCLAENHEQCPLYREALARAHGTPLGSRDPRGSHGERRVFS